MKLINKLLQKKIDYIGIDIGSHSVKVVELAKAVDGQRPSVLKSSSAHLAEGVIEDGIIKDSQAVVNALTQLRDSMGIKKNATANLAIAGKHVLIRPLKIPIMPLDELEHAVAFEAEKLIPTPLDQLYLDYSILGETTVDNMKQYSLLIAAAPQEMVHLCCHILEEAGFKPYGIEIEPLALYRMWHTWYFDEDMPNQALLNMGHSNCNMIFFRDDAIAFTRQIPIAGTQITQALAEAMGKNLADSEIIKHKHVLDDEMTISDPDAPETFDNNLVSQTVVEILGSLTQEVQRSIDFYQMQAKVRLDRIVITGGTANLQGLETILQGELNQPAFLGGYEELDPMFSLASGLAMKDFSKV